MNRVCLNCMKQDSLLYRLRWSNYVTKNHELDLKPNSNPNGWLVVPFSPEEPSMSAASKSHQKPMKGKDIISYFPLRNVAGGRLGGDSHSSYLWGVSLKHKELGFQNTFLILEMCRDTRKLNSTHSCPSGLRREHRNGPFHSLKGSTPQPKHWKVFFWLSGDPSVRDKLKSLRAARLPSSHLEAVLSLLHLQGCPQLPPLCFVPSYPTFSVLALKILASLSLFRSSISWRL